MVFRHEVVIKVPSGRPQDYLTQDPPCGHNMPTQYAVTIDTEEQWDWNAGWPVGSHSFENIVAAPQFEEACSSRGARTTWFTNWSVMNHGPSRETMLNLSKRPGVELGMHIHPWLTPPRDEMREQTTRGSFLATHPDDVVAAKLAAVYESFEANDVRPTSFRGGRYSSGGAIHAFLRSRGFVADSSVVPFTSWPDDGAPDYRQCDIHPQRLAPCNGQKPLWEIPLSMGFTREGFRNWACWFERFEHSWMKHFRPIGVLGKLGCVKRVWLNFEDTPAGDMLALLRVLRRMNVPCVVFTVHTSSLVRGGNPYSATQEKVDCIWNCARQVLETVSAWDDFEPATMTEVACYLEAEFQSEKISADGQQLSTDNAR